MKYVVIRNARAHRITDEADGWPDEPFIATADPVFPGWLYVDGGFVDPASPTGVRILDNQSRVDQRIATVRASLRGKSVSGMTAAERVDLIVIMARALGIEVRP